MDIPPLSTMKFLKKSPKNKSLFHSMVLIVLPDLGKTCADSWRGKCVLELSDDRQP